MNKIFRRLRSRAGESLIESMAAILIFTMGSIIMLSMVSTAADINQTAKDADKRYIDQLNVAEMTDMTKLEYAKDGKVTISINGASDEIAVQIFSNPSTGDDKPLYTFYESEGGGS